MRPSSGERPHSSAPPMFASTCRDSLDNSSALNSLLESPMGYSPIVYEVTIVDREGTRFDLQRFIAAGRQDAPYRPNTALVRAGFSSNCEFCTARRRVYQVALPFNLGGGAVSAMFASALQTGYCAPKSRPACTRRDAGARRGAGLHAARGAGQPASRWRP